MFVRGEKLLFENGYGIMSIMSENIGYGYHTMSGADKSETDVIRARTPCAEKKRTLRTTNRRREKRKNAYTADRRYGKNTVKRGTHEQRIFFF